MGKKDKLNPDDKFTLFVKLSRRIPNSVDINESVRELYSDVTNVRKPRQKSARFFLVDFETQEKAEIFKKLLEEKKIISGLHVKINKLSIKEINPLSKTENERKNALNSLTKQTFQSKSLDKYSSKLLVTNLPESVTSSELSDLFPNCQNLDLKHTPKLRAIVTYSSAKEAMAARMNVRPILDGKNLRVILLLLEDENRKRKLSDNPNMATSTSTHKFIKPLRYFESDEKP